MPAVRITERQARILRWWARRKGITVDQAVTNVFDGYFFVVEPTYQVETGDRRPHRKAKLEAAPTSGRARAKGR